MTLQWQARGSIRGPQGSAGPPGTAPGVTPLSFTSNAATPDLSGGKGHHRASRSTSCTINAPAGGVDTQRWMIEIEASTAITVTFAPEYVTGGIARVRTIDVAAGRVARFYLIQYGTASHLLSIDAGG